MNQKHRVILLENKQFLVGRIVMFPIFMHAKITSEFCKILEILKKVNIIL